MNSTRRIMYSIFASASLLAADVAAAHPGHGTPHILHQSDALLGWVIGIAGVCALGFVLARRTS